MPKCSMPFIPFIRPWFNTKFGDLCDKHDFNYDSRYPRKMADIEFAASIMLRGYPFMALMVYVFVRSVGWVKYKK